MATNSQETEWVVLMQQRDQQSQSRLPSNERWLTMSSSRDKAKLGVDEQVRESRNNAKSYSRYLTLA